MVALRWNERPSSFQASRRTGQTFGAGTRSVLFELLYQANSLWRKVGLAAHRKDENTFPTKAFGKAPTDSVNMRRVSEIATDRHPSRSRV